MATDWATLAKTNPYVAKALAETSFADYGSSAAFDKAISDKVAGYAAADNAKFAAARQGAVTGTAPAPTAAKARPKLTTTNPLDALRKTAGAFLGGGASGAGALLDDGSGTTKRRFLG